MIDPRRDDIVSGYQRACSTLDNTLARAGDEDLRRGSSVTRCANEELLFHVAFGYMVVLALLPLVKFFGHLPALPGKIFARLLNAGTRPFDVLKY